MQASQYQMQLKGVRKPISVMVLNSDAGHTNGLSATQTSSEVTPEQTHPSLKDRVLRSAVQPKDSQEGDHATSQDAELESFTMPAIDSASMKKLITELGVKTVDCILCTCVCTYLCTYVYKSMCSILWCSFVCLCVCVFVCMCLCVWCGVV